MLKRTEYLCRKEETLTKNVLLPINWLCSTLIGKKDAQINDLQIFERCFDLPRKRVLAMPTEPILDDMACPFAHSHSAHVPTYEVTLVDDVSLFPAAHLLRKRFPPQWQRLRDLLEVVTPPTRSRRGL